MYMPGTLCDVTFTFYQNNVTELRNVTRQLLRFKLFLNFKFVFFSPLFNLVFLHVVYHPSEPPHTTSDNLLTMINPRFRVT